MAGAVNGTLGVLASAHRPERGGGSDSWQAALLAFNSDDVRASNGSDEVTVSLRGLPPQADLVYATYRLDNQLSNPHQMWRAMGSPDYPTAQQFRLLRRVQVSPPTPPFMIG